MDSAMIRSCPLNNKSYQNWAKGVLCLKYIREEFVDFVEQYTKEDRLLKPTPQRNGVYTNELAGKMKTQQDSGVNGNMTIPQDDISKIQQIRNQLLHSTTMTLSEHEFKKCTDVMTSVVQNILCDKGTSVAILKKIYELHNNSITPQDEEMVFLEVQKSLYERTDEIQVFIHNAIKSGDLDDAAAHKQLILCETYKCPLQEENPTKLQNLIQTVYRLTQTHKEATLNAFCEIRPNLAMIEIELENLITLEKNIQRQMCEMAKKQCGSENNIIITSTVTPSKTDTKVDKKLHLIAAETKYREPKQDLRTECEPRSFWSTVSNMYSTSDRPVIVADSQCCNGRIDFHQVVESTEQNKSRPLSDCIVNTFYEKPHCMFVKREQPEVSVTEMSCLIYSAQWRNAMPFDTSPAVRHVSHVDICGSTVYFPMKCDSRTRFLWQNTTFLCPRLDSFCSPNCDIRNIKAVSMQSNIFNSLYTCTYSSSVNEYIQSDLLYTLRHKHCLEITPSELHHLFISSLNFRTVNPIKIFNAWLHRLTYRSLKDKKHKSMNTGVYIWYRCFLLLQKCYSLNFDDFVQDSDTNIKDIRYYVGENVALHEPENNDSFTDIRESDNARERSLSERVCEHLETVPKQNTVLLNSRHNEQNKRVCKQIYGTVNLKTGQIVDKDPLIPVKDPISESENDDKMKKCLIKQVIKGNSLIRNASGTCIVAPVSEGRSKKQGSDDENKDTPNTSASGNSTSEAKEQTGACSDKTMKQNHNSKRQALNTTDSVSIDTCKSGPLSRHLPQNISVKSTELNIAEGLNTETGSDANKEYNGEGNGACAIKPDNCLSKRNVDQISADGHKPSGAQDVQTDENESLKRLRQHTSLPGDECSFSRDAVVAQACSFENHSSGFESQYQLSNASSPYNVNRDVQGNRHDYIKETTMVQSSPHEERLVNTDISNRETRAADFPSPAVNHSDIQGFEPLMHIVDKIANGERVPPQITMQYEMLRFCTLRSYPKENKPFITRLAQAGFYYANSSDELVCYSCGRRKRNWQETDIPMDIHRQLNPNCKFLLRNTEVNVPIKTDIQSSDRLLSLQSSSNMRNSTASTLQTSTTHQSNRNGYRIDASSISNNVSQNTVQHSNQSANNSNTVCSSSNQNEVQRDALVSSSQSSSAANGPLSRMQTRAHGNFVQANTSSPVDYGRRQYAATSNKAFEPLSNGSGRTTSQAGGEGTSQTAMPKYPKYASKTVRITSFTDCNEIVVAPEGLAEAGFFYAGFGDCVRCFQCGVGLRHWSEEDDPWIEHSRWSKECSYVRQMRGQEFVNLVQMAVQYSQNQDNQGNSEQRQSEDIAGSNQGANGSDEVENLLHKDSAQSVLEMGYHPDLIRRAIRAVLEINGPQDVTAANLMEKIFELEEGTSSATAAQNSNALGQSHQSAQSTASASRLSESSVSEREQTSSANSNSQRPVEKHQPVRGERQSLATSENTHSRTSQEPSASAHLMDGDMSRASKKSQLLEQKKLKEENEKLKQQSICTTCKQKDVCIVFLPCGHLVTCDTCAPTVRYCTVQSCGKYIKGTVRTYLA